MNERSENMDKKINHVIDMLSNVIENYTPQSYDKLSTSIY